MISSFYSVYIGIAFLGSSFNKWVSANTISIVATVLVAQ